MSEASTTSSGWHPDPSGRHELRYWDGNGWTDSVSDQGTQGTDPVGAPTATSAYPAAAPAPYPATTGYSMGIQTAGLPISSTGRRVTAYLLDVVLAIVTLGIGWIIWSIIVWGKGTSPGKSLMKMKCVNVETGQLCGYNEMVMREIVGKWLLATITFSITTIVGIVQLFTADDRRVLWDKIGKTVVVDDENNVLTAS